MAIIKCPECGHPVSDKAPVCPSCGVEIAGRIVICPQCGEAYFSDQPACPHCHRSQQVEAPVQAQPVGQPQQQSAEQQPQPKKSHTTLIVSIIAAIIIVGGGLFFWSQTQGNKEQEAYAYAMTSDDPTVLQSYLDTYGSAPEEHRDSIESRLEQLRMADAEWSDALISGSKAALQAYLDSHPQSVHQQTALHKIDSIDWATAQKTNTALAYQTYIDEHANGEHLDEANDALKSAQATTVQPQEKDFIVTLFRHFFQSINTKNEDGLKSTVAAFIDSFLGKSDASPSDVVTFMKKIYKDDITNMNWRLNNDFKIDKKEVGDDQYEYTVQFSVLQDIERTDPSKEKHAKYLIKAKVGADQKISSFNMTKILQ